MRTIISTVGTSLMTNAARRGLGGAPDEATLVNALANTPAAEACAESNASGEMRVYPRGGRTERILFYEHGPACVRRTGRDEIRVCELARHSDDTYERLRSRGIRRTEYHFPSHA